MTPCNTILGVLDILLNHYTCTCSDSIHAIHKYGERLSYSVCVDADCRCTGCCVDGIRCYTGFVVMTTVEPRQTAVCYSRHTLDMFISSVESLVAVKSNLLNY